MGRPHLESRRALIAAKVSLAATHSVAAKVCFAKKTERLLALGPLLAMEPVRWASGRARVAETRSAAPASSSAELAAAFVQACHAKPPGQLPVLMKPLTNL